MKVIIYISNYNSLGGVETFVNNFIKRMNSYFDLTLLFDQYDNVDLLLRAAEHCNVLKLEHDKEYICDVFINSTAWGYEPYNNIKANKHIQVVHADYGYYIDGWNFSYKKHKKVTHHVCVGQTVKVAFEKATNFKCDKVIYNLLDNSIKAPVKPKNKKLHLVTLSRISGEKGFNRMIQLAEQLEQEKIPYIWNVWGDNSNVWCQKIVSKFSHLKNVVFNGITTEPFKEITKADYLVQLSDTEGFCYSVYEAMQMKTPCIITPFNSGQEQIIDGKNGYIVPFDMKGIDLNKIKTTIPKVDSFKELGKESDWLELIKND